MLIFCRLGPRKKARGKTTLSAAGTQTLGNPVDRFPQPVLFRGTAQSKSSAVIQPAVTASYAGFSANVWGNFDTVRHSSNPFLSVDPNRGNAKWSETDFTLSYTRELFKDFSVTVGDVYYSLQTPFPFDLNEVYGGVSYNFPWFTLQGSNTCTGMVAGA